MTASLSISAKMDLHPVPVPEDHPVTDWHHNAASIIRGHPQGQPLDRQRPANVEAEMGLLGAILIDNRAFERVSEFLSEEHFSEEFHRRIWRARKTPIERGQRADH